MSFQFEISFLTESNSEFILLVSSAMLLIFFASPSALGAIDDVIFSPIDPTTSTSRSIDNSLIFPGSTFVPMSIESN